MKKNKIIKNYYFTFGQNHWNIDGIPMKGFWVRVVAKDGETARQIFVDRFTSQKMESSDKFAFQYEEKDFNSEYFPQGEYAVFQEKETRITLPKVDPKKVKQMNEGVKHQQGSYLSMHEEIAYYRKILEMAGVPEFIIKYPQLIKKIPVTQEDIEWAKKEIIKYKENDKIRKDLNPIRNDGEEPEFPADRVIIEGKQDRQEIIITKKKEFRLKQEIIEKKKELVLVNKYLQRSTNDKVNIEVLEEIKKEILEDLESLKNELKKNGE